MVPAGSRVLELGCADGVLLEHLIREKGCSGQGVDIAEEAFHACMARGIPVVHADVDRGLPDFADASFDVVVASQILPRTHSPALVLKELMRVGELGIVSLPNFGHWRVRLKLLLGGRFPVTRALPHPWHQTPVIHPCTIADFEDLVRQLGPWTFERWLLNVSGSTVSPARGVWPNLLAAGAVYALKR